MRVIVVGATGTIGSAVVEALGEQHEVVGVSNSQGALRVDLSSTPSIEALYAETGPFDALVCAAGRAAFGTLDEVDEEGYRLSLLNKGLGQINLVRMGLQHVQDGGSFTLTSGVLCREPIPQSVAISPANAVVEAFVRAAALNLTRGVRINAVSPPWVRETLQKMGKDPTPGMPAARVAQAYVESIEGMRNGEVVDARDFG
jgi:NAD(P)-dependent dehydrogenase (short-subunit alcohol dehydrogenase family)